jgi:hypothetical protein
LANNFLLCAAEAAVVLLNFKEKFPDIKSLAFENGDT